MKQPGIFLRAEWRKLVMVNYEVDPKILLPYLPVGTELDFYAGKCLVSLVGFMFLDTRVMNIRFPYYINFEEFNLRFYVRYITDEGYKRGTVFISELVPKFIIPFIANTLYRENYRRVPMEHRIVENEETLSVKYSFQINKRWNSISVVAENSPQPLSPGSIEEFITEHYWGYNPWNKTTTMEYQVEHPAWETYPIQSFSVDCRLEDLYPEVFHPYLYQQPHSVLLAEGSPVIVRKGVVLKR